MTKILLWTYMILVALAFIAAFFWAATAHADPYCGAGSNFDARHPQVCGPGNPIPSPGYLPYPGPGQGTSNTGGYPNNYGGN